ncbi:MAG TPA: F0F1 ATP synthase subunit A [Ktedonobacteraceae bacterium]
MLWKLSGIQVAPEVIIPIFPNGNGITNTLLCCWLSIIIIIAVFYFGTRRRDLIPRGMQNFVELIVETLLGFVEGVAGKANGKKFFYLIATFFIFILVCNLWDVVPGVDTVGWVNLTVISTQHLGQPGVFLVGEQSAAVIPWLRPPTTDLNLNFAMALISVIVTQVYGFIMVGAKQHLGRFFNFSSPINFFVGIMELISELARIISLSFRLFGNIFAGGIVLAVFALLLPIIGDVIFIPFELFVAFIQAFIFALLTLVFLQIAVTSHDEHEPRNELEAHEEFAQNETKMAEVTH